MHPLGLAFSFLHLGVLVGIDEDSGGATARLVDRELFVLSRGITKSSAGLLHITRSVAGTAFGFDDESGVRIVAFDVIFVVVDVGIRKEVRNEVKQSGLGNDVLVVRLEAKDGLVDWASKRASAGGGGSMSGVAISCTCNCFCRTCISPCRILTLSARESWDLSREPNDCSMTEKRFSHFLS